VTWWENSCGERRGSGVPVTTILRVRHLFAQVFVLGVGLLIGCTAVAQASPKGQIQQKRVAAMRAQAEVAKLGMQLEPAIQRYDRAREAFVVVRRQINANRREIGRARQNQARGEKHLAQILVSAYKRNDKLGPLDLMLASRSFSEFVDAQEFYKRSQNLLATTIVSIRAFRVVLTTQKQRLAKNEARAEVLAAQADAEKQRIEAGLVAQRRLVRGLEREIRQLKAEERARQRRLAIEARQRLQRQSARALAAQRAKIAGLGASAGSHAQVTATGNGAGPSSAVATPAAPATPSPESLIQSVPSGGPVAGSSDANSPLQTNTSLGMRAVQIAMRYLGVPYVWGGSSPSGFDCSGLTQYAYAAVGVSLSHFTGAQWNEGTRISSMSDLQPGDLVFFDADLGHMGMYIGNGQMIHAPHTGDVVKISDISTGTYAANFQGGVRPY
jgi:cell wall-associated NlpC family hydrolase